MEKIFKDPQGNCQPYEIWQEQVVANEPDVFSFIEVDEYIEGWVYIDGVYQEPPKVEIEPHDPEPPTLSNEELTEMLGDLLMEIEELKEKPPLTDGEN